MSLNSVVRKGVTVFTRDYINSDTIATGLGIPFDITLSAAKVGQLTTRTSNTVGTLTMAASHGITTGARLDIYWVGGSRIGVTVGTVSVNSVPFTLGDGDNLPANLTAITAMVPNERDAVVDGDAVSVIAAYAASGCSVAITESDNTAIYTIETTSDDPAFSWTSIDGSDNPLASADCAKIFLSHSDSTQSVNIRGALMYD